MALPPVVEGSEVAFSPDYLFGDQVARREVPKIATLPFLGRTGYIAEGQSTLLASYPKAGKTTLLTALIPEWVLSGKRVLLLTEESWLTWCTRVPARDAEIWRRVRIVPALDQFPNYLIEHIKDCPEEIVVVDTLRNCLSLEDETDNSKLAKQVNPLIAACRQWGGRKPKTLFANVHQVKEPGSHGRRIAGGHALLGSFDGALELERVPGIGNRRKVVGSGARLLDPPDLLYDRNEAGELVALGEAAEVSRREVGVRVLDVLPDAGWCRQTEIRESLDDPRPGDETLRAALSDLVADGELTGDPAEKRRGVTYRYRRAAGTEVNLPPIGPSVGSEVGGGGAEPFSFSSSETLVPPSSEPTSQGGGSKARSEVWSRKSSRDWELESEAKKNISAPPPRVVIPPFSSNCCSVVKERPLAFGKSKRC